MEIFDNINRIVKTDLEGSIGIGSRISIAAACFSILLGVLRSVRKTRYVCSGMLWMAKW